MTKPIPGIGLVAFFWCFMSMKATLVHGPNFHLYAEALDDGNVYLDLSDCDFEASMQGGHLSVRVCIPLTVWETIRRKTNADFRYADFTDEQLQDYVNKLVDERIGRTGIAAVFGLAVFGPTNSPRQEQVALGLEYFNNIRKRQLKLRADIEAMGVDLAKAND